MTFGKVKLKMHSKIPWFTEELLHFLGLSKPSNLEKQNYSCKLQKKRTARGRFVYKCVLQILRTDIALKICYSL